MFFFNNCNNCCRNSCRCVKCVEREDRDCRCRQDDCDCEPARPACRCGERKCQGDHNGCSCRNNGGMVCHTECKFAGMNGGMNGMYGGGDKHGHSDYDCGCDKY